MNEVAERFKAVRALFARFNAQPSYASLFEDEEGLPTVAIPIARLEVVRVNPHFGADGEILAEDVYLYWKIGGRPHLSKLIEIEETDPYRVECTTAEGALIAFETADPDLEGDKVRAWESVQEGRLRAREETDIEASREVANEVRD